MALNDEIYMRAALDAARSVSGRTGDNPPVGCVLVRDGVLVASGATRPPPGAHAEVVAITAARNAGVPLTECVLYVSLEPCAFTGRTPPCSRLIVEMRPMRVVVACRDPHPHVRGAGLAEIKAAGIPVVEGVLEREASALLAPWFARFAAQG